MDLFNKVVLEYESDSDMIISEVKQMLNLVNTAVAVSHFKPSVAKHLDEDPEGFFDELMEQHIAKKVEDASDIIHGHVEEHQKMMEFIKEDYKGLHEIMNMMPSEPPEESARNMLDAYIDDLQEAREIIRKFFLEEISDEV